MTLHHNIKRLDALVNNVVGLAFIKGHPGIVNFTETGNPVSSLLGKRYLAWASLNKLQKVSQKKVELRTPM